MKMGKLADTCKLAEEIHPNRDLDELIQREIGDRVRKEMVPYLLNESQRFYSSLVVAVYGGDPEFAEVKVSEHNLLDDTETSSYGFGLLRFDGSQVYYALDGQHRLKSIQEAVRHKVELRSEDIAVIIIKHETTAEGMERTRRLFSTLNRRAKPTSSGMNIAIDEDDSIAIVTRRLVKEHQHLKSLVLADVSSINSKKLNPSKKNDLYITTLAALYECNEILLAGKDGGMSIDNEFKQFRKTYQELDEYYSYLDQVWTQLVEQCPGFNQVLSGTRKPGELRVKRNETGGIVMDSRGKPVAGGNIFARPIGQFIICDVIKNATIQGKSPGDVISAIMSNVSMDVDTTPWAGVVWNSSNHTIVGGGTQRKLISQIISYALGLKVPTGRNDLLLQYRNTIQKPKATFPVPHILWSGSTHESDNPHPQGEGDAQGNTTDELLQF